jgi:hypothetical protein
MKGALGLLVIAAVVWVFWMTYVFIKRTKDKE